MYVFPLWTTSVGMRVSLMYQAIPQPARPTQQQQKLNLNRMHCCNFTHGSWAAPHTSHSECIVSITTERSDPTQCQLYSQAVNSPVMAMYPLWSPEGPMRATKVVSEGAAMVSVL